MTAVLDTTPEHSETASTPDSVPASWSARVGALLVDTLPGAGVVATAALLALATPADDAMRWVFTAVAGVALFAMAVNRLVLPHAVGWTLGRALFGLRVAHRSGRPVGVVRLAVRELAHLLDTLALGVGWLWPLWDRRRRTFADLVLRTEVHRVVAPNRDMRRLVAAVLIGAAVVCVAARMRALLQLVPQSRQRSLERTGRVVLERPNDLAPLVGKVVRVNGGVQHRVLEARLLLLDDLLLAQVPVLQLHAQLDVFLESRHQ